ncbi:unnamed protein product [Pleuronectes platessa]|uniref:Uncharacterized protein n=1 Tax=Pleuronectes platessa TaxID=8262 RepID=A0A9N7YHH1_PLEPL|nr:unnamed protein product [Pleuronectes platessa]
MIANRSFHSVLDEWHPNVFEPKTARRHLGTGSPPAPPTTSPDQPEEKVLVKTYLETDIDAVRSNGEQPHLEIEAYTHRQPDIAPLFHPSLFSPSSSSSSSSYSFSIQHLDWDIELRCLKKEMNNIDAIRVNTGRALGNSAGQT